MMGVNHRESDCVVRYGGIHSTIPCIGMPGSAFIVSSPLYLSFLRCSIDAYWSIFSHMSKIPCVTLECRQSFFILHSSRHLLLVRASWLYFFLHSSRHSLLVPASSYSACTQHFAISDLFLPPSSLWWHLHDFIIGMSRGVWLRVRKYWYQVRLGSIVTVVDPWWCDWCDISMCYIVYCYICLVCVLILVICVVGGVTDDVGDILWCVSSDCVCMLA
jgi:hypothetical protein